MLSKPTNQKEIELLANIILNTDWQNILNKRGVKYDNPLILSKYGYSFQWDGAKSRLGLCSYKNKIISLSLPIILNNLNNPEQITDTLLHEAAHAIEKIVFKTGGHGYNWKLIASIVGANPKACVNRADIEMPEAKYLYACPNDSCDFKHPVYRKQKRNKACAKCCNTYNGGKYTEKYKLVLIEEK